MSIEPRIELKPPIPSVLNGGRFDGGPVIPIVAANGQLELRK